MLNRSRVSLLDLVEQTQAVLVYGVGQEPTLVIADITRGRINHWRPRGGSCSLISKRCRMPHDRGELARDLGLPDAGRGGEKIVADRLVGIAKPRATA